MDPHFSDPVLHTNCSSETQETTGRSHTRESQSRPSARPDFQIGDSVIYGIHGRCTLLAVETRTVGNQAVKFYKLEPQKSPLSRSKKKEPAIWLPVESAEQRGLRHPMDQAAAQAALALIESKDSFFDEDEGLVKVQPQLDETIRAEGGNGLAKVSSFLYCLKKQQAVPTSSLLRYEEQINRLLMKELADALDLAPRDLQERITKGMRQKLNRSH